ncbi:MAG: vitamin B12 dependent-methionine synthase activation domain-containing protein [Lentisphaeria bacterium]
MKTKLHVLTEISWQLDSASLLDKVHVEPGSEDADELLHLVQKARTLAKPKVLMAEAFVEARTEDQIQINGIRFSSRMLRQQLSEVQRVFPFVASCGTELDSFSLPADDLLQKYWWEAIKEAVLANARRFFMEYLWLRFRVQKSSCMLPGAGAAGVWAIEEQTKLFALLGDVKKQIGVELTDSFLMLPHKSCSGIQYASAKDFRSCQVCQRANCPGRSAVFVPELWDKC